MSFSFSQNRVSWPKFNGPKSRKKFQYTSSLSMLKKCICFFGADDAGDALSEAFAPRFGVDASMLCEGGGAFSEA